MNTHIKDAATSPLSGQTDEQNTLYIKGLAGNKTLKGTIKIHGAKNSALKAMAAAVLFDGPVKLTNVPETDDTRTLSNILTKMGASVSTVTNGVLVVDASTMDRTDIDVELAKNMRASVVLTGPMLGRFRKVCFPMPGGCVIGARPIDLFIEGYRSMGAVVKEVGPVYDIEGKLNGTEIFFDKVSVGGTETLMMSAVLANGTTVLKNCAMEPEIVNVAEWLNACGAEIRGAGTPTITVVGRAGKLLQAKSEYVAIPDRIETASYLLLGALCASDLVIENCDPRHIESVIRLIQKSGVPVFFDDHSITIAGNNAPNSSFKFFSFTTHEYPGVSTDIQAPLVTFLTQTAGRSRVFETVFEGRFKYIADLIRMGANISPMNEREIMIEGPSVLDKLPSDEVLTAHDIRAGFAIVMAALVGYGDFKIINTQLIDRGYEGLVENLKGLGANISSN